MAVETHVLFQEAEQMLNGEAPQVHAAQVLRCNVLPDLSRRARGDACNAGVPSSFKNSTQTTDPITLATRLKCS